MKLTEHTIEQELSSLLSEKLGASIITQSSFMEKGYRASGKRKRKQLDTLLIFSNSKIVLEIEIGARNLLNGIVQAFDYEANLKADGSIVIAYPESVRRTIESQQDVIDLVTETKVNALVLTDFLKQNFSDITIDELCRRIIKAKDEPQPTDLNLIVNVLKESVDGLVIKLRRGRGIPKPALERVVSQFELFSKLSGNDKNVEPNMVEEIACDLVAYVIVNQILLYFLLRDTLSLPELRQINNIHEFRSYFKHITDIDYRAVYNIDVLEQLPKRCLTDLNKIILAFNHLKPASMKHDLLGRMFHEFLPFKTRKVFAAFYTKPVAAELLARLAVNGFPERILEPARGSGTLLVAAYQALRHEDPKMTHDQALRKIYALDIMPFAAHLAALNLTLQDLESHTEKVNVGVGNSLSLLSEKHDIATQGEIFERVVSRRVDVDKKHEEEIHLPKQVNVVIMNPPYTDRGRLVDHMLGMRLNAFKERQNYWAYFLSFANDILAPGGIIAAVLPRLFLAGSTSREVRKWIFNQLGYELHYLVRTTKEFAFSESAAFRDFLVVLRKPYEQNNNKSTPCKVIYLNRSLNDISISEAGDIADSIRHTHQNRDIVDTADFTLFTIPQVSICDRSENLWFMAGFENPANAATISRIWTKLFQLSEKRLCRLAEAVGARTPKSIAKLIPRGFEPKPKGLYTAIFAVRRLDDARVSSNDMSITNETERNIVCSILTHRIEFPKDALQLGIKTASYFRRFEITDNYGDYIVRDRTKSATHLQHISAVKVNYAYVNSSIETHKTNLIVAKRINVVAPGSTFLSFCSSSPIVSPNTLYSVKCSANQSQLMCLWINSIFGFIQFLNQRMETGGGYCDILKEDLINFYVPIESAMPKNLNKWYTKYRNKDFPPFIKQFVKDSPRRELDRELMLWMGWREEEVDTDLDDIYKALDGELHSMRDVMRGS